jgi:hypothetical protein
MTTQTFTIWHHTEFGLARETRKAKNLASLFEKMPKRISNIQEIEDENGLCIWHADEDKRPN